MEWLKYVCLLSSTVSMMWEMTRMHCQRLLRGKTQKNRKSTQSCGCSWMNQLWVPRKLGILRDHTWQKIA